MNLEGNTALHLTAINDKPECTKLLVRYGANLQACKFWFSVFISIFIFHYSHAKHFAVNCKHCSLLFFLCATVNKEGKTALQIAQEKNFDEIVQLVCYFIERFFTVRNTFQYQI